MSAFFCKLVSPRPTFMQDITAAEMEVMMQHVAYWRGLIEQGTRVFALGPVLDPAGGFGVAIVELESEAALRALTDNDPAIRAGVGMRYEIHPMPRGVVHSEG